MVDTRQNSGAPIDKSFSIPRKPLNATSYDSQKAALISENHANSLLVDTTSRNSERSSSQQRSSEDKVERFMHKDNTEILLEPVGKKPKFV